MNIFAPLFRTLIIFFFGFLAPLHILCKFLNKTNLNIILEANNIENKKAKDLYFTLQNVVSTYFMYFMCIFMLIKR